ncbi:MAG: hypothetical protein ACRDTC_04185 [Pseudonocardiaceae bacterium]
MPPAEVATTLGFTFRVPETWLEFDVWRATRTGDLARGLDTRIAQAPELEPYRGTLLKALRQAAADAERHGAVCCAAMLDPVADVGMLAATLMVFQTDGAADPANNAPEVIASQVTAVAPVEAQAQWRRVEIVQIPAGRAVRVHGVETTAMGGQSLDCVVMQTLIPLPHERGVLNMVLTSPQVELAESMLDLFDAISSTLTWLTTPGQDANGSEASLN